MVLIRAPEHQQLGELRRARVTRDPGRPRSSGPAVLALLHEVPAAQRRSAGRLGSVTARPARAGSWDRRRSGRCRSRARTELVADQEAHAAARAPSATYPARASVVRLPPAPPAPQWPAAGRANDTAASWAWWAECWVQVYRAAGVSGGRPRASSRSASGPSVGLLERARRAGAAWARSPSRPGGWTAGSAWRLDRCATRQRPCCSQHGDLTLLRLAEVAREEGVALCALGVRRTVQRGQSRAPRSSVRRRGWRRPVVRRVLLTGAGATEVGALGLLLRRARRPPRERGRDSSPDVLDAVTAYGRSRGPASRASRCSRTWSTGRLALASRPHRTATWR